VTSVDSGQAVVVGGAIGVGGTLGATIFASLWGAHRENKRFQAAEENARHARIFKYRRKWYQDFVREVRTHINRLGEDDYAYRDELDDFFVDFDVSVSQVTMYGSPAAVAIAEQIHKVVKDPTNHGEPEAKVNHLLDSFIAQMRRDLDVDRSQIDSGVSG